MQKIKVKITFRYCFSNASKKLKEEVATLQGELASMAKAKAEADTLRAEEKAAFLSFL